MKYNTSYEKDRGTCLPPEAYIRLFQSVQQSDSYPRFQSTVLPLKKTNLKKKSK